MTDFRKHMAVDGFGGDGADGVRQPAWGAITDSPKAAKPSAVLRK